MALVELVFRRKQRIHTALSHSCNHTLSVLICSQWTFLRHCCLRKNVRPLQANSDYGRFNCNNMGANSQSWNYRSCWHQTGPLLGFTTLEKCDPIHKSTRLYMKLVITSSECLEWESFAPAATRGYSRYLSGAFSGSPTVTARYPW